MMSESQGLRPAREIPQAEDAWNRRCPHCGADVQASARRCWQCRKDFPAEGADELDYRPTDPEGSLAGTASVLLAVGLSAVVIGLLLFVLWTVLASVIFFF
jgi:hypothetical protein